MKPIEEREQVLKVTKDLLKEVQEKGRPRLSHSENGRQLGREVLNRWSADCNRLNTLVEEASAIFTKSDEKLYWIADEEIQNALDYACFLKEKYMG
jgi:hypothetical protein